LERRSVPLKDGSRLVGLEVDAEAWALAESVWRNGGYFGPEDYLNAILNGAMMAELNRHEAAEGQGTEEPYSPPPPLPSRGARSPNDLDDDIPF
jgi:hypothetical protein